MSTTVAGYLQSPEGEAALERAIDHVTGVGVKPRA